MMRAQVIQRNVERYFQIRKLCSTSGNGKRDEDSSNIEIPPEPTTCCMSGCQNCVWIAYANELTKILGDGGEKAREIVLKKITDPSLQMFLRMELQNLDSSSKKTL